MMDDSGRDAHDSPDSIPAIESDGKKPYRKPAFQVERVFETTALACGKITSTQSQCRFNTKAS